MGYLSGYKIAATDYLPRPSGIMTHKSNQCDPPWGQFHKTLQIHKLRNYSYGQIFTIILLIISQIQYLLYGHFAVNYVEKSFMEKAPDLGMKSGPIFSKVALKVARVGLLKIYYLPRLRQTD